MSNLTLAMEDELLRAARIKALQQGTNVNEICREAIARFVAPVGDHGQIVAQWRALSARVNAGRAGAQTAKPARAGRAAIYDAAIAERLPALWASLEASAPGPGKQ